MNCENCNQDHNGEYGSGRFCNAKCARGFSTKAKREEINQKVSKTLSKDPNWKWNPKERRITCLCCNNPINHRQRLYCSHKCQQDDKKEKQIKKWKQGNDVGYVKNTYGIKPFLRRYLFEKYNNECAECGWNKINPSTDKIPLEVHHIDGNCKNNKEENLILLCPNCHSLTSTFKVLNKGNTQRQRTTFIIE